MYEKELQRELLLSDRAPGLDEAQSSYTGEDDRLVEQLRLLAFEGVTGVKTLPKVGLLAVVDSGEVGTEEPEEPPRLDDEEEP